MTGTGAAQRPRRIRIAALVTVCATLIVLVVAATLDGLVYYRTPTELAGLPPDEALLRVGGLVVEGSVADTGSITTLLLTDGATELVVRYPGRLPEVVQEGEGAVVEGTRGPDGVLDAQEILLRHSNEYRAAQPVRP